MYNGALGTVVDIIYEISNHPRHNDPNKRLPAFVIVEFPEYQGEPFLDGDDNKKLVPISMMTLRCEKHCCERSGFPLVVQKGKTIHSFQGLTAGEGETIRRVVIHLEKNMEARSANLTYTAFSRTKLGKDVAPWLDLEFLKKLGNYEANKLQRKEIEVLRKKANKTKKKYDTAEFPELMKWFIEKAKPKSRNWEQYELTIEILNNIQSSLNQSNNT